MDTQDTHRIYTMITKEQQLEINFKTKVNQLPQASTNTVVTNKIKGQEGFK